MRTSDPRPKWAEFILAVEWSLGGGWSSGKAIVARVRRKHGDEAAAHARTELERFREWAQIPRNSQKWADLLAWAQQQEGVNDGV